MKITMQLMRFIVFIIIFQNYISLTNTFCINLLTLIKCKRQYKHEYLKKQNIEKKISKNY